MENNNNSIRKDIKIIYFFQQQTIRHFNVYIGYCIEFAKKCCKTEILSYYPSRKYIDNIKKIRNYKKKYKSKNLKISFVPTLRKSRDIQLLTKLFLYHLRYKEVIIIARKINLQTLQIIKNIFPETILIYESEGDAVSEYNFISKYDKDLVTESYEEIFNRNDEIFKLADKVVAGTKSMATLLRMRYSLPESKFSFVIPTFSKKIFFFDEEIREKKRKELDVEQKKVYIYTGSIMFAWQNYDFNVRLFKEILKKSEQSYFISLVPERDICIAKKMLDKEQISPLKYSVISVENYEVAEYLMAADMAFIIRDIHTMNYIAPTAKTGEYLATGLPLIYTRALGLYNEFITKREYGIIEYKKQDLFCRVEEIINFKVDSIQRTDTSRQAAAYYSFESNSSLYIEIIEEAILNKHS